MPETTLSQINVPFDGGTGSAATEVDREFLRKRVALFGKVIFFLCGGFYLLANLILQLQPNQTLRDWFRLEDQFHLLACAVMAGVWVLSAKGRPSLSKLRAIDAAGTILACCATALLSWSLEVSRAEYQALLGMTSTLTMRAVIVPSRPSRTLWIGILSSLPAIIAALLILTRPAEEAVVETPYLATAIIGLWCGVSIAGSTVTSFVIYGLRREVRRAMQLGQYTLDEKLGAGGMGVVYKARHALLRRPTAIKLLRCDIAGENNIARFEREVQLTSLLTHPNTISIYDYGRTPDGIFYYAMEYLPGLTLDRLVTEDGPQSPGRVIHVLKQVCASLAEAHSVGLIHRDIKGPNVIITKRGGLHDVVKVVDFGLVKDITSYGGGSLSVANTIAGTPHYLSPEAITSPGVVDGRSDLYAVGVLGYYLLTGKHVFEEGGFVEICGHHLHTKPVPPSARMSQPIPKDLESLILMCLEKDPAARPKDAGSLVRALEACESAKDWNETEASAWWGAFETRERSAHSAAPVTAVLPRPGAAAPAPTAIAAPLRGAGAN